MAAETVAMPRGMITDRNGHILARSVSVVPYTRTEHHHGHRGHGDDAGRGARASGRSDQTPAESAALSGLPAAWTMPRPGPFGRRTLRASSCPANSSVFTLTVRWRASCSVSSADGKGLEGIERSFDEQLGGLSVRQAVRRDASGREFYVNSNYEAQPAEDVHLTSICRQSIAEEEISKDVTEFGAKWGGVLVVDVAAGDVLAWAQFPFFNPNSYNQYRPMSIATASGAGRAGTGVHVQAVFDRVGAPGRGRHPRYHVQLRKRLWKRRYITIRMTAA